MNHSVTSGSGGQHLRETLIEVTVHGAWRRVAAIDPITGTEGIVHGPSAHTAEPLIQLAIKRLRRQLESERSRR